MFLSRSQMMLRLFGLTAIVVLAISSANANLKVTKALLEEFRKAIPIFPQIRVSSSFLPFRPGHVYENEKLWIKNFRPKEGCSVNATSLKAGDYGSIVSPNYPEDYPESIECLWMLESEPGTKIHATLFDFETQPWFFTYYDYLLVSEDGTFDRVDRYSGDNNDNTPKNIVSSANKMGLLFKTSSFLEYRGFKIEYVVKPEQPEAADVFAQPFDGVCGTSFLLSPPETPAEESPAEESPAEEAPAEGGGERESNDNRIIGNSPAPEHAFPWMVAMLINGKAFCGGSIIDDQHVLTAAHCTDGATEIVALLGSHNLKTEDEPSRVVYNITAEDIHQHPNYDPDNISHDISIIKLPEKLTFSEKIHPICLPTRKFIDQFFEKEPVLVSGWGKTADNSKGISPTLQYTNVKVMPNANCRTIFRDIISGNQICIETTPKNSACRGDSGGPLFIEQESPEGEKFYMQLGIVSFGSFTCERGFPVGFTRTTAFLDYIQSVTGREF